ncbi:MULTISPECIES: hypothetical protein [unclassified Nostoc]|uniref:hypothetical protein n=1 Tax=unclassified Nostoc TaxID=2593658 RepID=UPI00391B89F0
MSPIERFAVFTIAKCAANLYSLKESGNSRDQGLFWFICGLTESAIAPGKCTLKWDKRDVR